MMRIKKARAPWGFKKAIHDPGMAWLKQNPNKRPDDKFWLKIMLPGGHTCRDALFVAYHGICAYSLAVITNDSYQVDHFHPESLFRNEAYDWANYRLAASAYNQRKNARTDLQDPFSVPIDACTLRLSTGEISYDKSIAGWELCKKTVEALGLNKGSVRETRKKVYHRYGHNTCHSKELVENLTEDYPFVAYEMLRKGEIESKYRQPCIDKLHALGFVWVR